MACGSTYIVPVANVWSAGNYVGAPGQINGAATVTTFRIGGLIVLPGIEAPSAERAPLILRPFDEELLLCKRYWQISDPLLLGGYGPISAGTQYYSVPYSPMRAFPTVSVRSAPSLVNATYAYGNQISQGFIRFDVTTTAGGGHAYVQGGQWALDARL